MKQSFLHYIAQKKLCSPADKILLAVSGGLDSMVMLQLFRECGFEVSVAHANFQLRGAEAEGDEKFVAEYCRRVSVPFFCTKFETQTYADQHQLSIQMAARELRYTWFHDLMNQHHFDYVATAHHLNDSIETVLLSLVRGSGVEGYDGIQAKNGKVIRPLLFATRQEIENYATENKISWREDRSNTTDDYSRNFIRHQVIPKLNEINPSLVRSFDQSIEKISGAVELMAMGMQHWRDQFQLTKGEQIILKKNGFDQFKNPKGVLWNLVKGFGFTLDQCGQIIKAMEGQPGKKFTATDFELTIDRHHIIISKSQAAWGESWIESGQTEATLGNYNLKIELLEKGEAIQVPLVAALDASRLGFPLRWRKWKAGDFFYPLGMNHKKKLSDFLIDQKISLADKETVTVLESGSEIVWVVGMRVDERYKASAATTTILVCRLVTVD